VSYSSLSLAGLTIAITASRRANELAYLVTAAGGTPYIASTVGVDKSPTVSKDAEMFVNKVLKDGIDYAVFMTGPGVYSLLTAVENLGMKQQLADALKRVIVVARSSKPKVALFNQGIKTDIVPDNNTVEGIAELLKGRGIAGKRIAILWHGSSFPTLTSDLRKAAAEVLEFSSYTYSPQLSQSGAKILEKMGFNYVYPDEEKVVSLIEDINKGGLVNAILFTSPPSASGLFKVAAAHGREEKLRRDINKDIIVVAVGPSTKKELEEHGVRVDVIPVVYKMGSMVKALTDYVDQNGKDAKHGKGQDIIKKKD